MHEIEEIFNLFRTGTRYLSHQKTGKGNIHDSYLVEAENSGLFVLQKVNNFVFRDPYTLMRNAIILSEYLNKKSAETSLDWSFPVFYEYLNENYLLPYTKNSFWRLMDYIPNKEFDSGNKNMNFTAGYSWGIFSHLLFDLDPGLIKETIPDFHNPGFRNRQFDESLENGMQERIRGLGEEINFLLERREKYFELHRLEEGGKLPVRLTHNDTKLDNILFDQGGEPRAIIDLDTVMPGIIHADYGDSLRSFANSGKEDKAELGDVRFELGIAREFTKGFLSVLHGKLSPLEKKTLFKAPGTWIYMQAVRFLTDYFNEDVYYKTNYPTHNLDRARNQISLLVDYEKKEKELEEIIHNILKEWEIE